MSLFSVPTLCALLEDEEAIIRRPVNGDGGAQRFLRELVARIKDNAILLEDEELRKVERYAYAYGAGGFEDRFRALLRAAWRAGWN